MNSIFLMGRLVADADMRRTANKDSVCNFTIAVDRAVAKDGEKQTDFIKCVAWRGTADFIGKYFSKGQLIAIEGALQVSNYTTDKGEKRTKYEVLAKKVHFTGDRGKGASDISESNSDFGAQINDDDLPF